MKLRKRTWVNKKGDKTIRYEYSYLLDGVRKKKTFKKKPSLEELAELTKTTSENPYLKEAFESYIENHCKLHCKESTVETYQNYFTKSLSPLYHLRLKNVKRRDIERFIISLKDSGKAPKTINNLLTFIKALFNYYVENKAILENPAKKIKNLPLAKETALALTYEESVCFKKHCKQAPLWVNVFFLTMLMQGLRISECIALEWSDIDFKNKTMDINKQCYRSRVTSTKNYETRVIDIPDELAELLWELYQDRVSNLVFNSPIAGKHVSVSNMRERHFRNIIRAVEEELDVDLSEITPHSLRHTHATYLLSNSIPVIYVSKRLGHRDCKTTLNIYNHSLPSDNEKALDILNKWSENGAKKTETQQNQWRGVRVV